MKTIPQGNWPTKRLRFVTRRQDAVERKRLLARASQVSFLPMEAIGEDGHFDPSCLRDIDDVRTGYSEFFDGDVVIAKITPCFENGKGALVRELMGGVGFGTTELHVLTPSPEIDGRFLYYVTMSAAFRQLGEAQMTGAAGQKRVPEEFIRNYKTPIPPVPKQQAIVGFLDGEIARLDALVDAKEQFLKLLTERRAASDANIILRGTDPNAKLRECDASWLDRIPEGWDVRRLAWLFRERDERSEPDLPLLEVSINSGVTLRELTDDRIESVAADFNTYKIARKGDVVFNKMRMWQGAVGVAPQDGLVSPDYVVAAPTGELSTDYAGLLFRTSVFSAECARRSHGIVWDRLRLYWEGFRDIVVPLPPLAVQSKVVASIKAEASKFDAMRSATETTIALLKERRSVLIYEAVNGQIAVGSTA